MAVLCEILPFFQFFLNLKSTSTVRDHMIRCKTILGGHKVGVLPHIGGEQSDFYPDFRILQNAQSIKKCAVHHLFGVRLAPSGHLRLVYI